MCWVRISKMENNFSTFWANARFCCECPTGSTIEIINVQHRRITLITGIGWECYRWMEIYKFIKNRPVASCHHFRTAWSQSFNWTNWIEHAECDSVVVLLLVRSVPWLFHRIDCDRLCFDRRKVDLFRALRCVAFNSEIFKNDFLSFFAKLNKLTI